MTVEKKNLNPLDVYNHFLKKYNLLVELSLKGVREKNILENSKAYLKNSKYFSQLLPENKKADFLITSPPYPNTYDY